MDARLKFPIAEKFLAPQGEGLFTGTMMAFIRLIGCSVGKTICTSCDTEFLKMNEALGGGLYTADELHDWVFEHKIEHVCLTGGEPLDRDIRPLLFRLTDGPVSCHIETSGTVHPDWLDCAIRQRKQGVHKVFDGDYWREMPLWVTVSPKPGWLPEMVENIADEVKLIIGGLGDGPGWPTIEDALYWEDGFGKLVYIQPRNEVLTINQDAMAEAISLVTQHPSLRLSMQAHKYIRTR